MFSLGTIYISLLFCWDEAENDKINKKRKFDVVSNCIERFYDHKQMSSNDQTHVDMDPTNIFFSQSIYKRNRHNDHPISIQLNSSCDAFNPNTNFTVGKEILGNGSGVNYFNRGSSITCQPIYLNNISSKKTNILFTSSSATPNQNFSENSLNRVNKNIIYENKHLRLDMNLLLDKPVEQAVFNSEPRDNSTTININNQGYIIPANSRDFIDEYSDQYMPPNHRDFDLSTSLSTDSAHFFEYTSENTPMKKVVSMVCKQKHSPQKEDSTQIDTSMSLASSPDHGSNVNPSIDTISLKPNATQPHTMVQELRGGHTKSLVTRDLPCRIAMFSLETKYYLKNLFVYCIHNHLLSRSFDGDASWLYIITRGRNHHQRGRSYLFDIKIKKFYYNDILQYNHFNGLVSEIIKQEDDESCNVIFSLEIKKHYYQTGKRKHRLIDVTIPETLDHNRFFTKYFVAYNTPLLNQPIFFRHMKNWSGNIYFNVSLGSDSMIQKVMENNKCIFNCQKSKQAIKNRQYGKKFREKSRPKAPIISRNHIHSEVGVRSGNADIKTVPEQKKA